jgi:hypothetical protein
VSKLSAAGSALVYSRYLVGSSYDSGSRIALEASGNVYVTGVTSSTDFPTLKPFQPVYSGAAGGNAFVAKLSAGLGGGLLHLPGWQLR